MLLTMLVGCFIASCSSLIVRAVGRGLMRELLLLHSRVECMTSNPNAFETATGQRGPNAFTCPLKLCFCQCFTLLHAYNLCAVSSSMLRWLREETEARRSSRWC